MMKFIVKLVVIAGVVGGIIGMKFYGRGQASEDVLADATAMVATLPDYETHQTFFASSLPEAHERAFSSAYDLGGRRRAASFDAEEYRLILVRELTAKAHAAGRDELVPALSAMAP